MSDNKKFLFDLHYFDDNNVMHAAEDPNAPPPAPTFSEEELENAKKAAFEDGKKAGEEAAMAAIQEKTAQTLQSVQQSLSALFDREQERLDAMETRVIDLCAKVIEKLYPELTPTLGFAQLREFLRQKLGELRKTPTVDITLHPSMAPMIETEINKLKERLAAQGSWTILEDDGLSEGSCEISWKNGGADWKPDQIYAFIEQALEPHITAIRSDLDGLDQNLHNEEKTTDPDEPTDTQPDEPQPSAAKEDEES